MSTNTNNSFKQNWMNYCINTNKVNSPIILILSALVLCICVACSPIPSAPEATVPPITNVPLASPTPTPVPEPTDKPTATPAPESVTVKIQLAGDILLHGYLCSNAKIGDNAYDFSPYFSLIAPYIDGDISICNMESPVDVYGNNDKLSAFPHFNVPYEILETLRDAGFNHLITANNHAFDQGLAGVEATIANIRKAGLTSTGTYTEKLSFDTPTIIDVNGINIGIIAYTDSYNGRQNAVPSDSLPYLMRSFKSYHNLDDVPNMSEEIHFLRSAGAEIVIVSVHWGEEYVDYPTPNRRAIAHALCDAGADIIMGHHPHCVQPIEWYTSERSSDCLIIYSLGNFFADQIELDPPQPKTQYGMLVDVYVTKTPGDIARIDRYEVLPTLTYRSFNSGSERYRILPLFGIFDDERPEFISDNAAWDWCKRAYNHIDTVVGLENN